jgi:O-antigen/teichoic acid export membrane protein
MTSAAQKVLALARNRAVLTLADQAVMSGGNFLMQLLLLRAFTREEFGLYGVGFTVVQFLLNTQAALVTAAYMVHLPKLSEDARPAYAGSTLVHQLIASACGVAALAASAATLYLMDRQPGLGAVLACQAVVLAFVLFRDYARQLSFAGLRVTEALGLDTIFVGVQFAGMGLLAWRGELTAPRAFLVMGLASLLAITVWWFGSAQRFRPSRAQALADWRRNWRFSRWIFATSLAFLASNLAYPWVLLYFHGPAANGVLSACLLIGFQLINPFILGIGNFIAPRSAHALHEEGLFALQGLVRKVDLLFAAVVGGYFVVLLFAGEWILGLFSGGKYPGEAHVVHWLALGQLFFALTITANHALNALEQPNIAFQALLLAALVTWTAGVWLVWQYGALGAAAGQTLGAGTALLYTRWRYAQAVARQAGRQEAQLEHGG